MSTRKHPVVWFEVLGQDAARLRRFYGELFDWKIKVEGPAEYGMVDTAALGGIPGGVGKASEGTRSWVTFYVATPDVAAALAAAQRLGGKVAMPRKVLPDGTPIAVMEDPEGHVIGLVEARAA